jgi:hypothetical protein
MYGQSYVVTGGIDGSVMVLDVSHSSLSARSLQTLVAGRAVVKHKGNLSMDLSGNLSGNLSVNKLSFSLLCQQPLFFLTSLSNLSF